MFVGILIGFILGVMLTVYVSLPFASWPKFIESTAVGFGIGAAFVVVGWVAGYVIKLLDKQSQKVKSGAAE